MTEIEQVGTAFVLFAVGSAIVADFAESCNRAGHAIAAGICNRSTPSFLPRNIRSIDAGAADRKLKALPCLCPLFTPRNRYLATREAEALGFKFNRSLVDPTAIIASDVIIGGGTYINAGVIVGAASAVSHSVLINRSANLGHHATVEEFASIGPGVCIAGQVTIGRGAFIGAGATVGPKVKIGAYAVVGAGAVVLSDVPSNRKVFGIPARVVGEAGVHDAPY